MLPDILTSHLLAGVRGIRHGFFCRNGGVSSGEFESLNIGLASGDLRESVLENRRIVADSLGLSADRILNCYQIHSSTIVRATEPWGMNEPKADGMVTEVERLGLAISAADCAPVLACNSAGTVCGAAHVGWRGAISGIIQSLVKEFTSLGVGTRDMYVCIGPCIQASSYEVGDDMVRHFEGMDPANRKFFSKANVDSKFYFDLPAFIEVQMKQCGVGRVDRIQADTYSESSRFFSARRSSQLGHERYGRMFSVIALCP